MGVDQDVGRTGNIVASRECEVLIPNEPSCYLHVHEERRRAPVERALRLEPRLIGARLNLAQACELAGGRNAEALTAYKGVLEYDPSNAIARQALAASEAEQGHYQQSLNLARPVLDSLKQNPAGLFVLATDFVKLGNRNAARIDTARRNDRVHCRAAELARRARRAMWPG